MTLIINYLKVIKKFIDLFLLPCEVLDVRLIIIHLQSSQFFFKKS